MRARDKDSFPVALHDGLYGCGKCGTYYRLSNGQKLACRYCRTSLPLIRVDPPDASPADDTPARRSPSPTTDRELDSRISSLTR